MILLPVQVAVVSAVVVVVVVVMVGGDGDCGGGGGDGDGGGGCGGGDGGGDRFLLFSLFSSPPSPSSPYSFLPLFFLPSIESDELELEQINWKISATDIRDRMRSLILNDVEISATACGR